MLGQESRCDTQQQGPRQRVSFSPAGHLPGASVQPHLPSFGGPGHPAGTHPAPDVGRHGTQPPEAGTGSAG